jgi:hypothetical protein
LFLPPVSLFPPPLVIEQFAQPFFLHLICLFTASTSAAFITENSAMKFGFPADSMWKAVNSKTIREIKTISEPPLNAGELKIVATAYNADLTMAGSPYK